MRKEFTSSTIIILKEAEKRKIKTEIVFPGHIAKLTYKDRSQYLYHQFISKTTSVAYLATGQKEATKFLLSKSGISVAKGSYYLSNQLQEALEFSQKLKWPVVLKPTNGAHGDLVFANISNEQEFKDAWKKIKEKYNEIIVEEKFVGMEYRIFATEEKMIAALQRIPANVLGNGKNTLKELIAIKNKDPQRGDRSYNKPLLKIEVDEIVEKHLQKQKMNLEYIPKKNEQVFLRENSNISTGGDSIDYTDKIHPSTKKLTVEIIKAIPGLKYAGIDLMTPDISQKLQGNNYIVVEVNSSPGIDMHHYPYQGKSRDAAGAIIDLAFPETKK